MLGKLRTFFSIQHSLSRKLLVRILLFSSVFTLVLTASQLYLEFRAEESLVLARMELVSDQYVGPLVNELWEVDTKQINVIAQSIFALPDVTFVELVDNTFSKKSVSFGERLIEHSVLKHYPLIYKNQKLENINLGVLNIEFTYSNFIRQLGEKLTLIFFAQLFKTLIMSLFIFLIIQNLIIHHINDIAKYMSSLRIDSLDVPLALERPKDKKSESDELGKVVDAINDMRIQLHSEISDHKQSRQLIAEGEQRSRTVLNSLAEGVISYNLNDEVVAINVAAENMTGWKHEDAIGKEVNLVFNCVEAEHGFRESANINKLINASKLVSRKGCTYLVAISKAPIVTEQASLLGTVLVFRDITDEVQLRQTAHHNDKLRALGQLSGGIAHDINNILAVISGASELLSMSGDISEQNNELLTRITDSSLRGGEIIDRLLAFSRKGPGKREKMDVHLMIDEAFDMLNQGENKNISITLELNAKHTVVMGDSSSLGSCLMNLGINAIHSMKKGGDLTVRSSNTRLPSNKLGLRHMNLPASNYVLLEISDTGTGIDPNDLAYIFEPFFTTKQKSEGVGLGLWSVYGTIREHNGDISVNSIINRGTTFKILLPIDASQTTLIKKSYNQRRGSETILLIDDEKQIVETETQILQSLGYRVLTAYSGDAGIKLYKSHFHEIDIVILDLIMPDKDGIDTLKELRKIHEQCPVMISSGYSEKDLQDELSNFSNIYTIKKPHSFQLMSEKLASIFEESTLVVN